MNSNNILAVLLNALIILHPNGVLGSQKDWDNSLDPSSSGSYEDLDDEDEVSSNILKLPYPTIPIGTATTRSVHKTTTTRHDKSPSKHTRRSCSNHPKGYSPCKENSFLCIPQASFCNKINDCPNGSDEDNCVDKSDVKLWDDLFTKRVDMDAEKHNGTCHYMPPGYELASTTSTSIINISDSDHNENDNAGGLFIRIKRPNIPFEVKHLVFSRSKEGIRSKDGFEEFGESSKGLFSSEGKGKGSLKWDSDAADDNDIENDSNGTMSVDAYWKEIRGCLCVFEKLFCQNLELPDLHFIPESVEFLDLSGSRVDKLDFTSPSFPRVHTLVLSGCYIEDIVPGAFNQLQSLEVLYLTNNRLRSIADGVFTTNATYFYGESPLLKLLLDYNQISQLHSYSFQGLVNLEEMNLGHNRLNGKEVDVFRPLSSLRILHLSYNEIKSIRAPFLEGLEMLETLWLSNNVINFVEVGAFQNLTSLKYLFLNWNKLWAIKDGTFCNLRNLHTLNLRGNEISELESEAFRCLDGLTSLNIEKNKIGELSEASIIFENLTSLQYIYFDHFWMCSWAYHVRSCEPKGDGISSVKDLLDNIVLRVSVWVMGLLSIGGNCFVIFCRMILREPNRVHSFYIRNLAAADLLMGFFLVSIAIHDMSYRGNFLTYQYAWRHSFTCQISGLLSTWSSESSVLILTLITLDRYVSIVQPFAEKSVTINSAFGICMTLWIISFLLSYIPLSGLFYDYFGPTFYTGNGLCLPLHIHNPYDPGWEYSLVLFVILNSGAFIFICFAYAKMLSVIKRSTLMIRSNQQKQDSLLAKRFAIVVLTDFICWAPIVVAKIMAMAGVSIPSDLYAWLAVFALPVNSALNPIIYTLTTKLFKQQFNDEFQIMKMSRGFRSRLCHRRHPLEDSSMASMSMFRYRASRTANTSLTQSTKRSTFRENRKFSTSAGSTQHRTSVQLQIVGPLQSATYAGHNSIIAGTNTSISRAGQHTACELKGLTIELSPTGQLCNTNADMDLAV